ncbi:MAG: MFS transporter [Alphaproteobacteria bacterium]
MRILPVKRSYLLLYGALAMPLAFAGLPIYVHAPAFYASALNVSLTIIGLLLLVLRAVDAIQDPLIGLFSDYFSKYRLAIMAVGALMLGGGFWMLFNPLYEYRLIWFAGSIFICTTGFSVLTINYHALGGLWDAAPIERTRITSWREAIGLIGLLVAAITPTLLGGQDQQSFYVLSLLYVPLLGIAFVCFVLWFKKRLFVNPLQAASGHIPSLALFRTSWARWFFGIYLLNGFASSVPAVLVIFFINDRIMAPEFTGLFLLLYFSSGIAAMPLWQKIAALRGKYIAWMLSMILASLIFMWAFMLGAGDVMAYGIICILSGLALGADLALPPALLADHIDNAQDQAGAARYFAAMAFLTKTAFALATGIALPVLGLLGYDPAAVSKAANLPLSYAYALIPSMLKLMVALLLWRFIKLNATYIVRNNI